VDRHLFGGAIDSLSEHPFRAVAVLRPLPGLRVAMGCSGPLIHHRTRDVLAGENDDIALLINLRGLLIVRCKGDDLVVNEGDACLVACFEAGDCVLPSSGHLMLIRIARGALGAFAGLVDDALGSVIPARTEALALLVAYARTLPRGELELSPGAGRIIVDHVADLVCLIVGAKGEVADVARRRGLAAARLDAIKAYIRERMADIDLTPEAVAAAHGISPRYMRQLFESGAENFSGYLLAQRLGQAHAMLTSARFAGGPISDIAYDVGFADLSYFNRTFRRRYQSTPRDVRAEAVALWRSGDIE
jgi:AraC-like DNA-binding protein